jgi:hypothetical protein
MLFFEDVYIQISNKINSSIDFDYENQTPHNELSLTRSMIFTFDDKVNERPELQMDAICLS